MSKYSESSLKDKIKENPFPVLSVDPKEKEKDSFGKRVAKNIYYSGLGIDLSTNRRSIAAENRAYASNRQDIDKFKSFLDAEIDDKGNESHINIDWSIAAPGKKFVDTVVGDMMNQDHKIQFNAIDKYSKAKVKKDRDSFYAKLAREKELKMLEQASGVILESRGNFTPRDAEEIEIYMSLEYKQAIEIGMEQICDFILYDNDWDVKVKKRVIHDIVENGAGGVRLYFDRNNKINISYSDIPMDYYSSSTDEQDHSDADYQAERKLLSIAELKKRDLSGKIKEEDWFKIARKSEKKYGNPEWRFGSDYDMHHTYNGFSYAYNDFRVEVLDFIFYTEDKYKWSERDDRFGRREISRRGYDYKTPERSSKNYDLIDKDIEMSYEGMWVVDSDIMIGYGRSKNIIRPYTKSGGKISSKLLRRYIVFQPNLRSGGNKSIVDVMKPHLDNIQELVLRKRHLIAEMTPTGVAIDVAGISDVMSLLKEEDPMRIIKLYKQKGVLLFTRTDINGNPANGLPVQELNNPFAENLAALDSSIIAEIQHIRDNTGINDVRDGSSPDKDALIGIEKMRLLASNNTTREIYKAYSEGILSNMGKVISRMVQAKFEHGDGAKEYENIIGELGVKAIEFANEIAIAQLGIKIEALPTDKEIEDLMKVLELSLANKEIGAEDYLEVKRINNIKKAERLLIYRKKRHAERQMEEFAQKEQITAQREASSSMAAAEADKVKKQTELEVEIKKQAELNRLKKDLDDHETTNKIKLLDRESYHKQKLLEIQMKQGKSEAESFAVDKPKVNQNPVEAIERQASVNP